MEQHLITLLLIHFLRLEIDTKIFNIITFYQITFKVPCFLEKNTVMFKSSDAENRSM